MDDHLKNIITYIHNMKAQVKPDDYYKFVEKIRMICNAEVQDRPLAIEEKPLTE